MKFLELLFGVFAFILIVLFVYSFDIESKETSGKHLGQEKDICIAIDKLETTCWDNKSYKDFCKRLDACK